jgi:WD40 repeat protein
MQVIERDPVRPRRLDRKVPADLETIVLKAMAKKPADRYPTAQALADDLRRYLKLEPIQARRIGPVGRLVRWSRRHPTAAALVAVCVLSGLGLLALGLGMWRNAEQRAEAVQDLDKARSDLAELETKIRHEQEVLDKVRERAQDTDARLAYEEARALKAATMPGRRWRILELLKRSETLRSRARRFPPADGFPPPQQSELRTEAVAALLMPDARLVREVVRPILSGTAVSADGRVGAAITWLDEKKQESGLRLVDLAEDKDLAQLTIKGIGTPFALSPDGKQLAVGGGALGAGPHDLPLQVQLWQVGQNKPARILDVPKDAADGPEAFAWKSNYSPDGRFLAGIIFGDRNHYVLWDLDRGMARDIASCGAEAVPWAVFSHNGKRLAVLTGARKIAIWDLAADKKQTEIELPLPPVLGTTPAFGDRLLAFLCQAKNDVVELLVWDTHAGKERLRLAGSADPLSQRSMALSPDEQWLAAAEGQNNFAVFDLASGKRTQHVEAHLGTIQTLAWKPDSAQVISAATDGFRIWELVRNLPRSTLLTDLKRGTPFAFSPDGQYIAVGSAFTDSAGRIRLLHRAGRQSERELAGFGRVIFSADGRQIAAWGAKDPTDLRLAAWEVATGKPIPAGAPKGMFVMAAAFSPDGGLWAAGTKGMHEDQKRPEWQGVWDVTTNREVLRFPAGAELMVSYLSSQGRMLLSWAWGQDHADLWELPAGQKVGQFPLGTSVLLEHAVFGGEQRWLGISHFVFSLTGKSEAKKAGVTIFDLASGAKHLDVAEPYLQTPPVISAEGRLLAVAFHDGSVQVWDIPAKQELFRWNARPGQPVDRLAFTPEGGLAMSDGSSLQLLDLPRLRQQLSEIGLGW